jgi:hypothetical protein
MREYVSIPEQVSQGRANIGLSQTLCHNEPDWVQGVDQASPVMTYSP